MKNSNSTSLGKRKSDDGEGETSSGEAKKPKLSASHYNLKAYIGERRGEREDMQDAHTIIDDFTSQFPALPNNMYVTQQRVLVGLTTISRHSLVGWA